MAKLLNMLGFIVGLLGLVFGIYTYLSSQKKSEISYNIYSPPFKIYDSEITKEISSFNLYFGDSVKIKQNIYLTTFSIWNSGDLSINKSDLRKKIVIEFDGIIKVLDLKTIKEVESSISNIKLLPITNLKYSLDWDYFDPNNGLKIQIIYAGSGNINCKVSGIFLRTIIKEFIPVQDERNVKRRTTGLYVSLGLILIVIIGLFFKIYRHHSVKILLTKPYLLLFIYSICMILYGIFGIYYFFLRVQEIPF